MTPAAIDFTTIEVWTKNGLVTFYLLFVMELKTRRVHFAGCTPNPHECWMKQIARELILDPDDEVGRSDVIIDCRERLGGILKYYHRQAA